MSSLTIGTYAMPAASLGKESPLPDLGAISDAHEHIEVDYDTITPEEARYMGWGRVHTILPYTVQDGYNRRRRRREFKAVYLENEYLKAVFLPELGGRLWSLYDKEKGRELLHVNPVFQPCNLALRNAWISGGVEWNIGIVGHTPFTVDDMACETLTLSDGTPVLRMAQYERVRHLFYRVEAFLPDGARELYVRVRIDNALQEDTAVYWWSNMAVNEGEDIRVIVPAEKAYRYGYGGKLSKVSIPYMTVEADKLRGDAVQLARKNGGTLDWDISRTMTLPQAMDFFFDVPPQARPFIAAVDKDGYGMCQTSTGELRGRKLFVWGMGKGGRHWQTFLSKPGSKYIELQSGLAHTQLEHLPMAAGATISWLESYGAVQADADRVQEGDWLMAYEDVARALEAVRPAAALEMWHERVRQELDGKTGTVFHQGMGFAWAEKAVLKEQFDPRGLNLNAMRIGEAEQLWISLAETGSFPCPDPLKEPLSYQIAPHWEKLLRQSVGHAENDHWFARYHLGVMADARGDARTAEQEYRLSLERSENPWAMRCLALCEKRKQHLAEAASLMCCAANMKPIRPLVVEALDALLQVGDWQSMLQLDERLPKALRASGRVKTYRIAALMRSGRIDEAGEILRGPIVLTDVREGNTLLTDLWFEYMAISEKGVANPETIAWAEANRQPPKHLDFRMK